MKNKVKSLSLLIITIFLMITIIIYYYYYQERTISYEYVIGLPKFHNCYPKGINYIENEERMYFWLVGFYQKPSCKENGLEGYDSLYVSHLFNYTDFSRYDYVISYMRKISLLKYSPHLTEVNDNLYFDKRTPIIAEFEKVIYDSVFIYRIKKNPKFRAPGP